MVLHLFLHPVMKFYETIHNAPWSPEVKQLIVQLPFMFLVLWISLLCSSHCLLRMRLRTFNLTVTDCAVCTAHTSKRYIELCQSLIANRHHCHSADQELARGTLAVTVGPVLGSLAWCQSFVWSRHWGWEAGATCLLPPSVWTTALEIKDTYFLCLLNEKSF